MEELRQPPAGMLRVQLGRWAVTLPGVRDPSLRLRTHAGPRTRTRQTGPRENSGGAAVASIAPRVVRRVPVAPGRCLRFAFSVCRFKEARVRNKKHPPGFLAGAD